MLRWFLVCIWIVASCFSRDWRGVRRGAEVGLALLIPMFAQRAMVWLERFQRGLEMLRGETKMAGGLGERFAQNVGDGNLVDAVGTVVNFAVRLRRFPTTQLAFAKRIQSERRAQCRARPVGAQVVPVVRVVRLNLLRGFDFSPGEQ